MGRMLVAALLFGCAAESEFDRAYVSSGLERLTGHGSSPGIVPDVVTEDKAVADRECGRVAEMLIHQGCRDDFDSATSCGHARA
jgi:hypothetical protein